VTRPQTTQQNCPAQHHQHPQDWRSAAGVYDASAAVTGNPHRGLFWCALGPIPGAFGMGDAISRALRSVATGADQTEKLWSMKGKACATRLRRTLKHGYSPSPSDTVRVPVVTSIASVKRSFSCSTPPRHSPLDNAKFRNPV